MTIIKHELKINRKNFLIWSIAIGVLVFGSVLLYPMMKESLEEMGDVFGDMGGHSAMFGMDKLSIYSPMGYYATQIGVMLSLGGALFAALLGSGMLSKEESGHTAEFLLTTPISRANVLFQKLAAMAAMIFFFHVISYALASLSFIIIQESIVMPEFLIYHVALFILHFQIGCICFGISAFTRKSNVGLGLGIAAILYFIDAMVRIIPDLEFLKYITPYYYAGAADIFVNGKLDGLLVFIGIIISVVSVLFAYQKYTRKDIAS